MDSNISTKAGRIEIGASLVWGLQKIAIGARKKN